MGNKTGRPPFYTTAEEMQEAVDKYFKDCEGTPLLDGEGIPILDKAGEVILLRTRPPTVTGLALALGFAGRQALINYQGRGEFKDTITRAKARVEAYAEERLFDREGQRGAEFSLRHNFKWAQEKDEEGDTSGGIVLMPEVGKADIGKSLDEGNGAENG